MEATLLRVFNKNHYAVVLHSTRAVVCVIWECNDSQVLARPSSASYACPVPLRVELGAYDIGKAAFHGSLRLGCAPLKQKARTQYKRVPLSSL